MAGKITQYPNSVTTLTDGDLFDVSDYDEVSAYESKKLTWANLLVNINTQITLPAGDGGIYGGSGGLITDTTVSQLANNLKFKTNGNAQTLYISAADGRVGIATTTPAAKLDVVGNALVSGNVGIGVTPTSKLHVLGSIKMVDGNEGAGKVLTDVVGDGVGVWTAATDLNGIYGGSGSLNAGATTVAFGLTDTLTFGGDALHIDNNSGLQRVGINRTTFTRSGALEVNGATTYNTDALYTVAGDGIRIDGTNGVAQNMMIFNRTAANTNTNILFQETGTNVGAIQYDLYGSGTRKDGIKFYANGFATDGETIFLDRTNDNVLIPNGNLGIGTNTPTEVLEVTGNALIGGNLTVNSAALISTFSSTDSSTLLQIGKVGGFDRMSLNSITGGFDCIGLQHAFTANTNSAAGFQFNSSTSGNVNTLIHDHTGTATIKHLLTLRDGGSNKFELLSQAGGNSTFRMFDSGGVVQHGLYAGVSDNFLVANASQLGIGTTAPTQKLDVVGTIQTSVAYNVGTTKVVGAQAAAVADSTDVTNVAVQLNDLLAKLRTHGLIA